jgi:hypothetical protein
LRDGSGEDSPGMMRRSISGRISTRLVSTPMPCRENAMIWLSPAAETMRPSAASDAMYTSRNASSKAD